jgi:hypothetical protein
VTVVTTSTVDIIRCPPRNVGARSFHEDDPQNASGTAAPLPVPRFRSVEQEDGTGSRDAFLALAVGGRHRFAGPVVPASPQARDLQGLPPRREQENMK